MLSFLGVACVVFVNQPLNMKTETGTGLERQHAEEEFGVEFCDKAHCAFPSSSSGVRAHVKGHFAYKGDRNGGWNTVMHVVILLKDFLNKLRLYVARSFWWTKSGQASSKTCHNVSQGFFHMKSINEDSFSSGEFFSLFLVLLRSGKV